MRLNPHFVVDNKKYEIKANRMLDLKYQEIKNEKSLSKEEEIAVTDFAKLQLEYAELAEKFKEAKEDYLQPTNIRNKDKKEIYLAYKELADEKFKEVRDFELHCPNLDMNKVKELAYENGVKVLIFALTTQCDLTEEKANEVWDKFVDHFGTQTAHDWISAMLQELFDEDEENPFLAQAKAKAEKRAEAKKGFQKIKK